MKPRLSVMDTYEMTRDDMESTECFAAINDFCMPHFHQCIEMVFIKKGVLTAIVDGKTLQVHKNQMLICSSYAVHTYMSEEPNETVIMIIPMACVPSMQKKLQKKSFASPVWDVEASGKQELIRLIPMLPEHWDSYGFETRKGISYMLLGMAMDHVGLTELSVSKRQGPMRDALREVLSFLQENYQQPLKMEDVARQFGYSKSRFSRLFHDCLGCSMNEYVMALRCRHAAEMLLDSELTMLDIALNVGFECLRTFYRAFHACYQCTPSQYVKAHT